MHAHDPNGDGETMAAAVMRRFRPVPYLRNGLMGGLLGGAVAGIVIGVGYHWQPGAPRDTGIIPEITAAALLIGAVTAIASQLGIGWFSHLGRVCGLAWLLNEFSGGACGGLASGIPLGALMGCWFGLRDAPPVDPALLVGGALFGSWLLTAAVLLFDSAGQRRRVLLLCLVPLAVTSVLYALAPALFSRLGFDEAWFALWLSWQVALRGGAEVGALVGGLMGAQIGLTQLLYARWYRRGTTTV